MQDVLSTHALSGERSWKHRPYLAGSLFCDQCGSKLVYSVFTGRRNDRHDYWGCVRQHRYKNGCDLPYLAAEQVEAVVTQHWQGEAAREARIAALRAALLADLEEHAARSAAERDRLPERQQAIQRDRLKRAEQAMDSAVPRDIARAEQEQLAVQLAGVEEQLATAQAPTAEHAEAAVRLLADCSQAYLGTTDITRRNFNQAWLRGCSWTKWRTRSA